MKRKKLQPSDTLRDILEDALTKEADSITMEWVQEGLEIFFIRGDTGLGFVIEDSNCAGELIGYIYDQSGLERKTRGKIKMELCGEPCMIRVKEYSSFGETALELKIHKEHD